jgi:TPR repeat protein
MHRRIRLLSSAFIVASVFAVATAVVLVSHPASAVETVEELQQQLAQARRGNADAQFQVGRAFETGTLLERDAQQAVNWYLEAAKRGQADAQFRLGKLFHSGAPGVSRQLDSAVKLYRAAARRGHPEAQNWLGYAYQHGHGVPVDYGLALSWYQNAADQGLAEAQTNLGLMYLTGQGVEQDQATAARWFERAAVQGNAVAKNNLAGLYETGWGVERDEEQAHTLYRDAALTGNELALDNLRRLGLEVPAEGERLARLARLEREDWRVGGNTTAASEEIFEEGDVLTRDDQAWAELFNEETPEPLTRDNERNSFGFNWFGGNQRSDRSTTRRNNRPAVQRPAIENLR